MRPLRHALLGVAILLPLDAIHVAAGVLVETSWPLACARFALLGVALGWAVPRLVRGHRKRVETRGGWELVAAYAASCWPAIAVPVVTSIALVQVARRARIWRVALVLALVGPALEMLGVRLGGWSYAQRELAGVPAWLPALWACGASVAADAFAL